LHIAELRQSRRIGTLVDQFLMLSDSDIHGLSNHHSRAAALAAHVQRADGISGRPP